ncbi:hypothetical protein Misp06_00785 [Microbulbifer sp. NBRC 101763]|uniref:PoNe immunity protein domain-containing protein n=1 Tax=Microbulbifer sp. NBRC 101763 TaxID=1113820 RepID=UPI0030A3F379
MVRDSRRDKEYFDQSITVLLDETKFFEKSAVEVEKGISPGLGGAIYSGYLRIVISLYSAGYSIGYVKEKYLETIDKVDFLVASLSGDQEQGLTLNFYNNLLWTASLAVLLDVDEKYFLKIADSFKVIDKPDRLIDLLLSYKLKDIEVCGDSYYSRVSDKMADRYRSLLSVFETDQKEKQVAILRDHLKLWYKRQQLCTWYGSHNKQGYFGYWSFETAAVAKILKISNASLSTNRYFPNGFLLDPK